jgi:hypothetical protein
MVDIREKLPDVAFQHPACPRVILGNFSEIISELIHRLVRAFVRATRIRIVNKLAVEKPVQLSVNRVVHQPIPHACLVDVAGLRVVDLERLVG